MGEKVINLSWFKRNLEHVSSRLLLEPSQEQFVDQIVLETTVEKISRGLCLMKTIEPGKPVVVCPLDWEIEFIESARADYEPEIKWDFDRFDYFIEVTEILG